MWFLCGLKFFATPPHPSPRPKGEGEMLSSFQFWLVHGAKD